MILGKSKPDPHADPSGYNFNPDIGPGAYTAHLDKPFGADMGHFTMQPKHPDKIDPTNGPGQYDPDSALNAVKPKTPAAYIPKSPSRPDRVGDPDSGGAGPGAYYKPESFDSRAKPITIPEKRERPAPDSTGPLVAPGKYDPSRGEPLTKVRPVSALILKDKRPELTKQDSGPDPGMYTTEKPFGSGLNKVPIQGRRPQRIEETPGPGTFNPDTAVDAIRPKSPMTKISKARARPKSFAGPSAQGPAPGQYDDGKRFNSNVKPMTIGKRRHSKPTLDAPGPGVYNPHVAEKVIRPKSAVPSFDKSPARPRGPPPGTDNVGPGVYDTGKKFGKDIKPMTIGRKRPQPLDDRTRNPGAGNYNPDHNFNKPKCPGVDMGKSPSRPSTFAKPGSDPYSGPAPGTYDAPKKFGNDVKPMTIGVKRPKKITTDAPGPDAYNP